MKRVRSIIALAVLTAVVAIVAVVWIVTSDHGSNLSGEPPVADGTTAESASSAQSAKVAARPWKRPPRPRFIQIDDIASDTADAESPESEADEAPSPEQVEFRKRIQEQVEFLKRVRGLSPEAAQREAAMRVTFAYSLHLRDDQLAIAEPATRMFMEQTRLWQDLSLKVKAVYDAAAKSEAADRAAVNQSIKAAGDLLLREAFPVIMTARDNYQAELEKLRPHLDPEQIKALDEELAGHARENAMLAAGLATSRESP